MTKLSFISSSIAINTGEREKCEFSVSPWFCFELWLSGQLAKWERDKEGMFDGKSYFFHTTVTDKGYFQ